MVGPSLRPASSYAAEKPAPPRDAQVGSQVQPSGMATTLSVQSTSQAQMAMRPGIGPSHSGAAGCLERQAQELCAQLHRGVCSPSVPFTSSHTKLQVSTLPAGCTRKFKNG